MEPILDPIHDRFVKNLQPPPRFAISKDLLYPNKQLLPDWQALQTHLQSEGKVLKEDLIQILSQTKSILLSEENLLELMDPVTIVGDIHGQFYDLLRIFELGGSFDSTKYLFLGDYVDRGSFSIEVILLLFTLKINYPKRIFLLRGNHECRQMTNFFNFRTECLHKYDLEVYDLIMETFDALPLACIVNQKFIGVHGGISPELIKLRNIIELSRLTEPPRFGLFCDLLWSDPIDNDSGEYPEKFKPNEIRGCSFNYSSSAVHSFLKKNKLLTIIRAHEVQIDGYKMHVWNSKGFPVIITLFSAPNYCDVYNNKGAVIKFNDNVMNIQQYNYSVHPYILPNFMDIFAWSVPFVIEKVMEMLGRVLKKDETEVKVKGKIRKMNTIDDKYPKAERFRKKVRAITKMIKMLRTLREEKDAILELKGLCPDNRIPKGLLMLGRDAIMGAVDEFLTVKRWDRRNEKMPK